MRKMASILSTVAVFSLFCTLAHAVVPGARETAGGLNPNNASDGPLDRVTVDFSDYAVFADYWLQVY